MTGVGSREASGHEVGMVGSARRDLGHPCDAASADDPSEPLRRAKPQTRQSLSEFVYDFMLQRFGVLSVAEAHLRALASSCERLRTESRAINLFGRLLGIFDPVHPDGACLAPAIRLRCSRARCCSAAEERRCAAFIRVVGL